MPTLKEFTIYNLQFTNKLQFLNSKFKKYCKLRFGNWNFEGGFTLVELLVVMAILGVLITVTLAAFRNSQSRGRDAQRKSDLKQISSSLELYYSDYAKYPDAGSGMIAGCPSTSLVSCTWGSGEFTDGTQIYFKAVPADPAGSLAYYYRIVDPGTNQKYQLFAFIENTQDPDLISTNYSCGSETCNFSITSTNTTPSE